jgi:hypothetical protein
MSMPTTNIDAVRGRLYSTALELLPRFALQARLVFVVLWMALWLYLGLGMVLLSFSALQLH